MREIKFRAWDRVEKMWIGRSHLNYLCVCDDTVVLVRYGPNNKGGYDPVSCQQLTNPEVSNLEIMQYTGIKDRDGNEIYEGDIVRLSYGIPPTYDTLTIEYADDEVVNDISVSGWWMRNVKKNGCSSSLCKTYENDLEVIGNVYANPDLLEGGA